MRYLRGGSLSRLVRQEGSLSLDRVGIMLNQIASALAVAHADGVVHRDLKPDNILMDESGNYYLSDFGIAKDLGSEALNLTQTGAIIGSPAYLSPEQITGEDITPLSDVYSLGILLHYTLTGEHPFPGKTPTAMLIHQMQDPMPPLTMHREDIPDLLEDVLQRATAKDPSERFGSVMELALAFNRTLRDQVGSTSQIDHLTSAEASLIITGLTPADVKNPYKGLKAFDEADSDEFYGREELTERLINRITPQDERSRGENLLVVVGPSGSGKSSVVKAGVIPSLRDGAFIGNEVASGSEDWFYTELVPGVHPMEEMEAALLRIAVNPPESLLQQLESDERGLVRAIKRVLPDDDTQLVIFIDQFEEVFTLTETEEERTHFLNSLMCAIQEPRNRVRVVVTLRADFYDRPLSYFEFGELVREHTEVVLPLSAQELENSIVRPAHRVGVTLEAGLTAAIISDVREQPGALPLLQYAIKITQLNYHPS
jgi:energy-coupling factor transporter ATP-binding protein EcfA2